MPVGPQSIGARWGIKPLPGTLRFQRIACRGSGSCIEWSAGVWKPAGGRCWSSCLDPVALENVRKEIGDAVEYCIHHYDACEGADAIAIVTEWNEFRNPDFDYIKLKMKSPVIFDGRNLYDRRKMAARGFVYSGVGLSALPPADVQKS